MTCAVCDFDPCQCGAVWTTLIRDTTRQIPKDAITKEAFGFDLYEAIACCSGVQQLLRMISVDVAKKKDVSDLSRAYAVEKARAKWMLEADTIDQADAARLARDYPWLLT